MRGLMKRWQLYVTSSGISMVIMFANPSKNYFDTPPVYKKM